MSSSSFVVFFLFLLLSLGSNSLLPFGKDLDHANVKEHSLTGVDDGHVSIHLKTPFIIDQEKFSSLFLDVNGIVSFDEPVFSFDPKDLDGPFIAPFWGDVDLSGRVSRGGNTLYYRVSEFAQDLEWVRRSLEEGMMGMARSWRPKTVFVATWDRVGYFMGQTNHLNTFQLVLATDGKESYGFFNYPSDGLNWWVSEQGQTSVVGFRTRIGDLLMEQASFEAVVKLVNSTNSGCSGRQIFKFDGSRPLLSQISYTAPPCFFGGSSLSVSGYGFVKSDSLKCRFSTPFRTFTSPASFVSFSQVTCDLPPWDANHFVDVSVSNDGHEFSEPVNFLINDCILAYFPVKTCIGGGMFTVESFPNPWNSGTHQYSCHFGHITTEATVENELLTCPMPHFNSSESVPLSLSLKDGNTVVKTRQFGTLKVHECGVVVNKQKQCSHRLVGIFWDDGNLETKPLKGVLRLPSGGVKNLIFVGKFIELDVPEDGEYILTVSGFVTSFEVSC